MPVKNAFAQLPLGVILRDAASFDNYISGGNVEAVAALRQVAEGRGDQCIFLWGGQGVGKSHLLQAVCRHMTAGELTTVYLPLRQFQELSPSMLHGLETLVAVCIDDIDAIIGIREWEEAIFHLYNKMRDNGGRFVGTGNVAPNDLPLLLPDLRSRLGWGVVFHLRPLSDEEKIAAVQLRARGRGIELPNDVAVFLLRHYQRDTASLFSLLDRLDESSLVTQRRITVPFVREILRLGSNNR